MTTQTHQALNFSAGPAVLPKSVLEQAANAVLDFDGTGIGILEHSHRSPSIDRVFEEAVADCRMVGSIPDDFEILFLQGGASLQFDMAPMNLLPEGGTADYIDTGSWTAKAIKECQRLGNVHVAWSSKASGYRTVPQVGDTQWSEAPAYGWYCSNNTIYGTCVAAPADCPAPLIADMSSDIFSRPIDWAAHSMVIAGAQKNIGPAGVTLVIVRRDLLDRIDADLPAMLDYRIHADKGSRYNTPPVFAVYCAGLVFKWLLNMGGIEKMSQLNEQKAAIIYDAIDGSEGFYSGHAETSCRSAMNIPFTTPSAELDAAFLKAASAEGMFNLKGHRSVGGIRASIYNAFPEDGCTTLANFMRTFAASH